MKGKLANKSFFGSFGQVSKWVANIEWYSWAALGELIRKMHTYVHVFDRFYKY